MDEITTVKQEAEKLEKEGIQIILAVGHSGFEKDKDIAKNVAQVDAVVGGK